MTLDLNVDIYVDPHADPKAEYTMQKFMVTN